MTPEAKSHHDQKSGASCDGTGPCFTQHFLPHLVQLAYSLSKAALPCREVWRHKALESANINVKLCSISLKQLFSKYLSTYESREINGFYLRVLSLGTGECRGGRGWL